LATTWDSETHRTHVGSLVLILPRFSGAAWFQKRGVRVSHISQPKPVLERVLRVWQGVPSSPSVYRHPIADDVDRIYAADGVGVPSHQSFPCLTDMWALDAPWPTQWMVDLRFHFLNAWQPNPTHIHVHLYKWSIWYSYILVFSIIYGIYIANLLQSPVSASGIDPAYLWKRRPLPITNLSPANWCLIFF
jgi:hypothetical protein